MKKFFKRFLDYVVFFLSCKGTIADEMVRDGVISYEGQGRDAFGKWGLNMSYICLDCRRIFEEGEQITFQENMGERFGVTCSKRINGCPNCGGEYEESKPCSICSLEHLEEDLNGGLCDECIDKYKNDIVKTNICKTLMFLNGINAKDKGSYSYT